MIFLQIKTFLRGIAVATTRENKAEVRKKDDFRLSEFNFRQLHIKGFTILEFLIVVMLSGIVITAAIYLMTFFQTGLNKKVQYEAAITDVVAFDNVLHQDIGRAELLKLDGFGNLMVIAEDQSTILYAQRSSDFFRNSTSLNQMYNFTMDGITYYFEGQQVDRNSLVDYVEMGIFDTYNKTHLLTFVKEYAKADLYNFFSE